MLRKSSKQEESKQAPLKMTPMKLGMKRVLCDNGIELKDNQDLEEIKQSQVVKKQKSQSVLPAN